MISNGITTPFMISQGDYKLNCGLNLKKAIVVFLAQ